MQAKADRLNAEQEEQAQNETNSVDDSDSSNTGNNSTGENEEQTEQVSTDKGLEETNKDDTRAPFVAEDQDINDTVKPESIKQEAAKGNTNSTQASKRVYVKADCPALPATPATNGCINAETTQLHPDAREDYFRLRLEIQQTIDQVKGLQDYINNVCLKE